MTLTLMRYFPIVGLAILLIGTPLLEAADKEILAHPDDLRALVEVKGKISSVDSEGGRVTVQDTSKSLPMRLKPDTRVLDSNNHTLPWTSLKTGDPVIAYYNTQEKAAIEIDVQPTLKDAVMGTPIPGQPER